MLFFEKSDVKGEEKVFYFLFPQKISHNYLSPPITSYNFLSPPKNHQGRDHIVVTPLMVKKGHVTMPRAV